MAIHGVQRLRNPLRWLLLAYPAAMSLALVYFAEHYVIDVVAGGLLALAVTVAVGRWERRLAGDDDAPAAVPADSVLP